MSHDSNNIMVILSSPSGAGKTTISKKIQQKYQNFKISVSHTTRKPRSNEVEGIDYYFIDENDFKNKIKNNEFYEYATIFGNYYGTSKESVLNLLKNKNDVLFDIDWQGTQQLSKFKELNLLKIFILPPSKEELKKRLIQRNLKLFFIFFHKDNFFNLFKTIFKIVIYNNKIVILFVSRVRIIGF